MMSLWDALRMNMMISYQELVRTFPNSQTLKCLTSLLMSQATIEFHRFCEHDRNNISPLPG